MTTILSRQKAKDVLYFNRSDVEALLKYFEDFEIIVAEYRKGNDWKCKQVKYYTSTVCTSL